MEATVAERGQITLPKAVRDALGLTKGTLLKVELDGSRIILRKNVDDAISRARGRFKLPQGVSTDDIMRGLRGHTTGYAVPNYVVDAPGGGGKIALLPDAVLGRDGDDLILRNFQGKSCRYPDPGGSLGKASAD